MSALSTSRVIVHDGPMTMDAGEDYLLIELRPDGDPRDGSMRIRLTPENWQRLVRLRERALAGLASITTASVSEGGDAN